MVQVAHGLASLSSTRHLLLTGMTNAWKQTPHSNPPISIPLVGRNLPKYSPSSSRRSISSSICLVISSIFFCASVGPFGLGGVTLKGSSVLPLNFNLPALLTLAKLAVGLIGFDLGSGDSTAGFLTSFTGDKLLVGV